MKPLVQTPAQPGPVNSPVPLSGPLPGWSDLPLARQQEVVNLLASLLLRHWPSPPSQPQEVGHDPQS